MLSTDNSDSIKETLQHNLLRPYFETWTVNNKPEWTADTAWSLDLGQVDDLHVVQSEHVQLCARLVAKRF